MYKIVLIGTTNLKMSLKKQGTYGHRTNKASLDKKGGAKKKRIKNDPSF